MILNHIISWGMAAMLTSLTMTTGSVDRNSTSSQNNIPASVEVVTEGCAANICPLGTEPFYYDKDNYAYTLLNVTSVSNWLPGYNPDGDCNGEEVACLICVSHDYIDFVDDNMALNSNLVILAEEIITNQTKVTGSTNDPLFDYRNENL